MPFVGPPTERAFGRALREFRLSRRLSQEALAYASGCAPAYVSRLERGIGSPTLRAVFAFALAMEVSPSEMIGKTEKLVKKKP